MGTQWDVVTISGTTFNDQFARVCDVMEGWESTPALDFQLVQNGGGPGAVLTGRPVPKELPITLGGAWVTANRDDADLAREQLLRLFPIGREIPVDRRGFRRFVWLLDQVDTDLVTPRGFRWTVPTLALDPFRYSTEPQGGSSGISTGAPMVRTYVPATFARVYGAPVPLARTYSGEVSPGVVIDSPGDAESSRIVIEVVGPLTAGDWRITNDATGEWMAADIGVGSAGTLTFDVARQTITRESGADVTHRLRGDWLTVAPGRNTFRLTAGAFNPGSNMTLTAFPAWR